MHTWVNEICYYISMPEAHSIAVYKISTMGSGANETILSYRNSMACMMCHTGDHSLWKALCKLYHRVYPEGRPNRSSKPGALRGIIYTNTVCRILPTAHVLSLSHIVCNLCKSGSLQTQSTNILYFTGQHGRTASSWIFCPEWIYWK